MGFDGREAVERGPLFKADGRAGFTRERNDFLNARASEAAGYEDTFERTLCAECFDDGVDSDENCQKTW
jgi:hypothetical protein